MCLSDLQPQVTGFMLLSPQSVEHLSWLGLFKDLSEGTHKPSPFYHKRTLRKTRKECEHVREKFLQMRHVHMQNSLVRPNILFEYLVIMPVVTLQLPGGIRRSEAVLKDSNL